MKMWNSTTPGYSESSSSSSAYQQQQQQQQNQQLFGPSPIVGADMYARVEEVYNVLSILISIAGILTNALNMKAFVRTAKEDGGIAVSLLALSASDFGFCVSCLLLGVFYIAGKIETTFGVLFPMDPWVAALFFNQFGYAFYTMTSLSTTFLAVARCMCVAKPLQFSNMFTRSRCIVVHVTFAVISLTGYVAVMTQMGAKQTTDVSLVNQTRLIIWFSDQRKEVKDVVFMIFDTFLTFTVQVILSICIFIMAKSLRESVQFRQSIKADTSRDDPDKAKQSYKLSGKELQVIQQVVLICVIYIVCSLFRIFNAVYSLIETDFDLGKPYNNLYLTLNCLRKIFDLTNSTSTFFIYYKYNSRFRELFNVPSNRIG